MTVWTPYTINPRRATCPEEPPSSEGCFTMNAIVIIDYVAADQIWASALTGFAGLALLLGAACLVLLNPGDQFDQASGSKSGP